MGAPVTRTRGTKQRVLGMLRWYAGMATAIHGETIENSLPGEFFSYTFESRNPATGDLLATVAEGDKEDIDRAVAAARAAFEGPWSKFKPYGLAGGGANPFAIDQHALDFAIGIGMPNGFDRLWHCHCLLLHFPIYIIKYNDEHGPSRIRRPLHEQK
jgi:hypothetical protein